MSSEPGGLTKEPFRPGFQHVDGDNVIHGLGEVGSSAESPQITGPHIPWLSRIHRQHRLDQPMFLDSMPSLHSGSQFV